MSGTWESTNLVCSYDKLDFRVLCHLNVVFLNRNTAFFLRLNVFLMPRPLLNWSAFLLLNFSFLWRNFLSKWIIYVMALVHNGYSSISLKYSSIIEYLPYYCQVWYILFLQYVQTLIKSCEAVFMILFFYCFTSLFVTGPLVPPFPPH